MKTRTRQLKRYELREYAGAAEHRVDTASGTIFDVRVLGRVSRNRREYTEAALDQAARLCEGAKVFLDHSKLVGGPGPANRSVRDWCGVLANCRRTADGVRANIKYLRSSPAGQLLEEAAQKFPDKFGLSPHQVCEAWTRDLDKATVVERIVEIKSVDVVNQPATVHSLFEEVQAMPDEAAAPAMAPPPSIEEAFLVLQNAIMASPDHDDLERIGVLKDVMKLKQKILGGGEEEPAADEAAAPPAEATESVQEAPAAPRRSGLRRQVREIAVRQMVLAEGVQVEESVLLGMVDMPDESIRSLLAGLKKAQRPRYGSPAPARVGGRREMQEAQAPAAPAFTTTDRNKLFQELQD